MNILLAGGTGLVGRAVTQRLAGRNDVALLSLVRTATLPVERAVEFERLAEVEPGPVDAGISCLGTTIRTAGSQGAFRRVDHDYVVALASLARNNGARQFILVSSVGAGRGGFYLRVKGEVEAAVGALGFERVDLIRPGLLLGPRAERRPSEQLAQRFAPLLNPFVPARYGAIEAEAVAAAITALVGAQKTGRHIHHNPELRALAA